jgi:hypothetical protein
MGQTQNREAEKRKLEITEEVRKNKKIKDDKEAEIKKKIDWLMDIPSDKIDKELVITLFNISDKTTIDELDLYTSKCDDIVYNGPSKYITLFCIGDVLKCFCCESKICCDNVEVCGCSTQYAVTCSKCRTYNEYRERLRNIFDHIKEEHLKKKQHEEKNGVKGL